MNIHFIAIGGAAMHNLALALHLKGDTITGSDDEIFDPSKSRLNARGILPKVFGWFPEKITTQLDAIVLGMHAKADNPELLKAQELELKIYSYPEFLYEQSKFKTRVVIGGSHGKTTITSMILHVMHYFNREVDYMVGAQLEGFDVMVKLTEQNDFIILEGDEYLSSPIDRRPKFHLYKPNIALLSGIAWDHINVFPTWENYLEQFSIFVDSIVEGGSITYNVEDAEVKKIVENSENTIRKFPYQTPDYKVQDGTTLLETQEGPMPVEIFGKHNLDNLAGAKWICQQMGIDENDFYEETDTLYSLWCAKDFINDDFLCLYADLVFEKEIVLNLINNNYEISLLIDNQKNHADSHSVFVVDKFVKSVRSKSEKCNSQFVGIVKFSKNGSIALNKILDNFHKQNNLDGEIIRIFEKLIDDSFPLHACFTNNQKWFNVNDFAQLESARHFFES